MGTKFSLGPAKESFASQRLEDKNRDKNKFTMKTDAYRPSAMKTNKNVTESERVGPPTKPNTTAKATINESQPESSQSSSEPRAVPQKGKTVPYVDVPPIKARLRSAINEPIKVDQAVKFGPTYKSRAPVEIGLDIEKLVESVLDLEINVPLRSLAGVSGAIQKEIKKQVTKTKFPIESEIPGAIQNKAAKQYIRIESLPVSTFTIVTEGTDELPEGSLVADDPVLQFLNEHTDAESSDLIVAPSSEPLRAIYAFVNHVGQEECLTDGGSMIVSMSKKAAIEQGLNWDPSIRINMESASNHVEQTLGLARNVHFGIGGLHVILQVRILEDPLYRVLLGRPFNRFTRSVEQTKEDGSSELVLTDPNSKRIAVVPTYERGVGPEELQKQRFQSF